MRSSWRASGILAATVLIPLLLGIVLPSADTSYPIYVLHLCGIAAIAAVGLNIVLGITGLFSMGHAGFLAAGAYVSALITRGVGGDDPTGLVFLGATLAGGLVAASMGWLVGTPSLRLKGDYLAIVTLGFGEITRSLIENTPALGGATGLTGVPQRTTFAWIFGWLAVTVVLTRRLLASTHGRALLAVREDEIAAESMGLPTTRLKVRAFVYSAFLAGVSGALLAHQLASVNPRSFTYVKSIEIVTMVVLGGMGSVTGSILAAVGLTALPEVLKTIQGSLLEQAEIDGWSDTLEQILRNDYKNVLFASILLGVMLWRPRGLLGRRELWHLWSREPLAVPGTTAPNVSVPRPMGVDSEVLLEASDVTIRFGGLTAVKSFSLRLRAGELVALIGPNGAGKTTVFNMLTGVYTPTSGTIRVGGNDTRGLPAHRVTALGAARTFQNIRLFKDLTVLDNVRAACHARGAGSTWGALAQSSAHLEREDQVAARAVALLDVLGLADRAHLRAGSLPYGEQRRLEIARALATEPRVLLLDEPAAGMNSAEKVELMGLIRRVRDRFGVAILLIEHDMRLVMGVSERIVVLDHGETIGQGTPHEVQSNPRVIRAYLGEADSEADGDPDAAPPALGGA